MRAHRQEVDELHKEVYEKDAKIEEIIDEYETQIKVRFGVLLKPGVELLNCP